jgi:hypothetical protein
MGKLQIAEVDFCQSYCYEITTSLLPKSISSHNKAAKFIDFLRIVCDFEGHFMILLNITGTLRNFITLFF